MRGGAFAASASLRAQPLLLSHAKAQRRKGAKETLKGRPRRYAVDASGNYRMTFGFREQDAINVDLEDYH
ncbi:MAG: hypothetical protein ACJ8EB_00270 [Allosphingosinicella sp.]